MRSDYLEKARELDINDKESRRIMRLGSRRKLLSRATNRVILFLSTILGGILGATLLIGSNSRSEPTYPFSAGLFLPLLIAGNERESKSLLRKAVFGFPPVILILYLLIFVFNSLMEDIYHGNWTILYNVYNRPHQN